MKVRIRTALSLIVAGIAISGYAGVIENLLLDPSFEAMSGSAPEVDTSPWEAKESTKWKVQVKGDYMVSGTNSLGMTQNESVYCAQSTGALVDSNLVYEVSGWFRTSNPVSTNPDAPALTAAMYAFDPSSNAYLFVKAFLAKKTNSQVDVWERFSAVLPGKDPRLVAAHGREIQIRFLNKSKTSHWLFIDDVAFGEYTPDIEPPPSAPEGLLIGWYGADSGNDFHAEGIDGAIITNVIYGVGLTSGSEDGTYGSIGGDGAGAVTRSGGYEIRIGDDVDNPQLSLGFSITNNTAEALELSSINFDYGRFFDNSPADIALFYDQGDLLGVAPGTLINSASNVKTTGKLADYNDYDWSLSALADTTLAPGESAQFSLVGSQAARQFATGAFDNIGIFVALPPEGYEGWLNGWGVDLGGDADDYDNDGVPNLVEYALGGSPINGEFDGKAPGLSVEGDTLNYIHAQRADDASLTYSLETCENLSVGNWTNIGYSVEGTAVTGGTFNYVTNAVLMDSSTKFIRLIVER